MTEIDEKPLIFDEDQKYVDVSEPNRRFTYRKLFFCLGNSSLLSFNIIINAIGIYCSLMNEDIASTLNRCYNIPNAMMSLLLCIWKPRNLKNVLYFSLLAVCSVLVALGVLIMVDISPVAEKYSTLCLVGTAGLLSSIIFSTSFTLASQFNEQATASVSSGNGCCGVLAGFLRIITKSCVNGSYSKYSNGAYFFLAAAIIFGTFLYLIYNIKRRDIMEFMIVRSDKTHVFSVETKQTIIVIWKLWFSEFLNFLITLSIFPGYLSNVPTIKEIGDWASVIVTFSFCIFDWVGRYLPNLFKWPSQQYAWIPIICRLLFYLVFIISLNGPLNEFEPWWTFCWMIPFALTNGYFGTISVIYGNNHPDLSNEGKRYAGLLMSFAVNLGILTAMGVTYVFPQPANAPI